MAQWTPERKETNRRRLHARRVHKKNPLFALSIISMRYPDYTEAMLLDDLRRRTKPKPKRKKKQKHIDDFRRVQLIKMKELLPTLEKNSPEYNSLCHKIALFHQAHDAKQDIGLTCRINGVAYIYYFHWQTKEKIIKQFHQTANVKGTTHEQLKELQKELATYKRQEHHG